MKIKTLFILGLVFIFLASCTNSNPIVEKDTWSELYASNNVQGTFILYDIQSEKASAYNLGRVDSAFAPASTFKIFNSLVSLQEGVADENTLIKWDSIDRGWDAWNRDMRISHAFSHSCVWFYQELARRVGETRMQYWLDTIGYGNQTMGAAIDLFWLDGDLAISANQQIEFLKLLYNDELSFDIKVQQRVKELMLVDSTEHYQIYAKTGWAMRIDRQIGWYVGFVETKDGAWLFANNIDIKSEDDLKYRKELLYEILSLEQIIP